MVALGGYSGRIVRYDLTKENSLDLPWKKDEILPVIGGRGLIALLLHSLLPPGVNPLGPENSLIFANGPFSGTNVPFSGRWSVGAKSPLTGFLSSGNAGGRFGTVLKWAGLDALVLCGKASARSYLLVDQGRLSLRPADHLWGKSPEETTFAIRSEVGDPRAGVVAMGKAAEEGSLLTTLLSDHHAAGRGGLATVMASKNLKAVVVRGTKKPEVFNRSGLNQKIRDFIDKLPGEYFYNNYIKYGSSSAVGKRYQALGGGMPFNGQSGVCPHFESINNDAVFPYLYPDEICFSCPMPCFKGFSFEEAEGAWKGAGVQTGTMMGYGVMCGMTDIRAILKAHIRTNDYSLDLLAVPVVIAFAMECYQKKIIGKDITEGLDLSWDQANKAVLACIELMGQNQGFGKLLNRGVRALSQEWGEETKPFAFHVKGMECTSTDGRVFPAWGLGYAVGSRGADHTRAYCPVEFGEFKDKEEVVEKIAGTREAADRLGIQGKGRMVAYFEDMRAIADSLELCKFPTRSHLGLPERWTGIFHDVTGIDWTAEELIQAGERIVQLERLFNLREGLVPADDTLPERFLKEPIPDGPSKGRVVDLRPMLQEYYQTRGWDPETGKPSPEKLEKLGLKGI
jgi:aldehyde:ferredoxin oxidoreductase